MSGRLSIQAAGLWAPRATRYVTYLSHFGAMGLLLVAVIDASIVPLAVPGSTDLLLALLVSYHQNPLVLTACATVGSVAGAYTTWRIGHSGGEAALNRWVPRRLATHLRGWSQRNPVLSVFVPAILPPPIPLAPFLLASGALGVPWKRCLTTFGLARLLRYALVAWLGHAFGQAVVRHWPRSMGHWTWPIVGACTAVIAVGIAVQVWRIRHGRKGKTAQSPHPAAPHTEEA